MKTIFSLDEIEKPLKNPVLTIGNFDGVHLGHLALFEKVKERAAKLKGQSAVMTFQPHPIKVMKPGNGPPLITPTRQKLSLIEKSGIDIIFCIPFTKQFAAITARQFIEDILIARIGIKEIIVGYDYTFGNRREGDIEYLRKAGDHLGFTVHEVKPVQIDHTLVSSTSIRNLIREGELRKAEKLLGRKYQISGTVVKGKNRGARLLGFPTANLRLADELTPRPGVYAVKVHLDNRVYDGVTNIGYNPTFGNGQFSVETHLLDFSEDLLEKDIRVDFIERLRSEKGFDTLEQLSSQIAKDVLRAREKLAAEDI